MTVDRPFDRQPFSDATIGHLDLRYIEEVYLPAAVAADVLAEDRRPLSRQMEALELLTDGKPTRGALLAAARNPQVWVAGAYVQYVRFDGTGLTSPIKDRKEFTGKLQSVLSGIDELIDSIATTNVDTASREVRRYEYPPVALKQLARNAVMHRSYEVSAPVRIYWFDDRIDIESPGGLYGRTTWANIEKGVTAYRNPLVAEMMYHLGFVQRFGVGIPIAKQALRDNGNPVIEFRSSHARLTATIRPSAGL